jgi:hypothetical protein
MLSFRIEFARESRRLIIAALPIAALPLLAKTAPVPLAVLSADAEGLTVAAVAIEWRPARSSPALQ